MARISQRIVSAVTLALLLAPLSARGESAQEKVALSLFEEGKKAFKAGAFEKSLPLFESAQKVIDNIHTQYYLGRAYAAVNRCGDALPFLSGLDGKLPAQVEGFRLQDETRCLLSEARAKSDAKDCRSALPMLERLEGKLEGDDAAWRDKQAAYCATRATDFPTDTATKKAAHGLYVAGIAADQAGDAAGAAALYDKALALADEPVIRRKLARAQVEAGGCLEALSSLEGIPKDVRTDADADLLDACGSFAPRGEVSGAKLAGVVMMVTSGLAARRAGKLPEALHHFDQASKAGNAPAVEAVAIDLLYELERCKQYAVRLAEASQAVQLAVTQRAERLQACGVDASTLAGPSGSSVAAGTTLSISGGQISFSTSQIFEWTLISTGVTALFASGLLAAEAQAAYDDGATAIDDANSDDTTLSEKVALSKEADDLQLLGDDATLGAQITLGIGIAALGTGLSLMLWGGDDSSQSASTADGWEIEPWIGDRGLGLAGRF